MTWDTERPIADETKRERWTTPLCKGVDGVPDPTRADTWPSRASPLAEPGLGADARLEELFSALDWGDDPGFDFDQSGPEPA